MEVKNVFGRLFDMHNKWWNLLYPYQTTKTYKKIAMSPENLQPEEKIIVDLCEEYKNIIFKINEFLFGIYTEDTIISKTNDLFSEGEEVFGKMQEQMKEINWNRE